ncbi:uncharacterized protein LOC135203857 [Macrobrachium nipponense]|uniref:uncharacterized protein LOC135203857 n=1 Tax=Macrobrachium nipponense TaxID=159736 RepID=UPI0030C830C0
MTAKTLLAFLMEVWFTQLTSALTDQVVLRPTSPYCTDQRPSSLVCDFSLTTQPVYLVTSPRPKRAASLAAYESIEIRNAAVFYLSESGCLAEINIRDTKEVIVDDLHQKKRRAEECERYQLSVVNSSITNIPAKVTGLNVVRSNVERLVLPPGIKRASVSQSRVDFFSTTHPLNGSVVFEVSFTNVSFVGKLNAKDNATFQLLSSRLTLNNMSEIAFEDNADILISRSHLLSPNTVQFLVERGVSVTLEDNIGKVTIKHTTKDNAKSIPMCREEPREVSKPDKQVTTESNTKSVRCPSVQVPNSCQLQGLYVVLLLGLDCALVFAIIYRFLKREHSQGWSECIRNFRDVIRRKLRSESSSRRREVPDEAEKLEGVSLVIEKYVATPRSKTPVVDCDEHSSNDKKDEEMNPEEPECVPCTPSSFNNEVGGSTVKKRKPTASTVKNMAKPKCLF